jgi:hypothetical protein
LKLNDLLIVNYLTSRLSYLTIGKRRGQGWRKAVSIGKFGKKMYHLGKDKIEKASFVEGEGLELAV